jgi:peptidoglycan/xylan/chitin deacetylase (PgdA/CDA1 family)
MKHMAARFPGPLHIEKHLWRSGLRAIFPFYHAISDHILPHTRHLYKLRTTAGFEADLDYLLRYFDPLSMHELLEGTTSSKRQKPCMVLSFDDGLVQCHREIMPMLLSKGIPATFFVNNDFIDNKGLFFRFKASLLLEQLSLTSKAERERAAGILQCRVKDIGRMLGNLGHRERELCDRVAECWNYDFADYLSANPVYLSSSQIREMIGHGFEFGTHGFDHPMFSMLSARESLDHIRQCMEDLQMRFGLEYRYFSFPFTDYGVREETIEELFRRDLIDAGFGTAGLKEDRWPGYHQRVPMEFGDLDAKSILKGELNRRRVRKFLGNNRVSRGNSSNQP